MPLAQKNYYNVQSVSLKKTVDTVVLGDGTHNKVFKSTNYNICLEGDIVKITPLDSDVDLTGKNWARLIPFSDVSYIALTDEEVPVKEVEVEGAGPEDAATEAQ